VIIVVAFSSAFLIMLEQWITWGSFWEVDQTLHHETFAIVLIMFACGMIIAFLILKRKR